MPSFHLSSHTPSHHSLPHLGMASGVSRRSEEGPKCRTPETAEKQWRCVFRPHGNRENDPNSRSEGCSWLTCGRIQAWVRALALGSSSLWALERQKLRGDSRVHQNPGIATEEAPSTQTSLLLFFSLVLWGFSLVLCCFDFSVPCLDPIPPLYEGQAMLYCWRSKGGLITQKPRPWGAGLLNLKLQTCPDLHWDPRQVIPLATPSSHLCQVGRKQSPYPD